MEERRQVPRRQAALLSRLVADGIDVKLAQAIAGHTRAEITLSRYSHLTDARIAEAALGFDPSGTTGAPAAAVGPESPDENLR